MRRRTALLTAGACAVAVAAAWRLAPEPDAGAASAAPVLGRYTVKLKGEGWAARRIAAAAAPTGVKYSTERVSGTAQLEITPRDAQVNDGLVTVRILLDPKAAGGLLGAATPGTTAFEGTAAVIGDSISLIDAGQPNYVNALTLRFEKAKRVSGSWMAVFPALEPALDTQTFATGVTVTLTGRRLARNVARDR